ncbi:hypothetical protein BCR33DRAFT_715453 [Rhizoclosmatium globosum]|uniref:Amino acid transporter transmembrane domain-containing protein n=1 Tax=Rhizoclosmatium globosum TaxID=329046 RepID=A0A1Y2CH13_9FUNG|nr:hypothetical protein BCR33DRAFT_715453 [Rhizoclosmatium globosum]|eukprot:ORY46340.1 hypothetical protein BCR33DRAFT_715453 [Rhizoclosmatium globosum]
MTQATIDSSTPLLAPPPATINEEDIEVTDETHHRGNTVLEAVYHLRDCWSGVLQLPYALNQAGWVGIGLVLLQPEGGRRLKGFSHIGYEAFGDTGRWLVEGFTSAMLMGVPIVYLILSGMNLELIFGVFSMQTWIVLSALVVLIPFLLFKTLKEIAIFSAFGVFATFVVTHKFVDLTQFASALGSISFSYAGNYIYPEVEQSMAEPKKFQQVLSLSMIIISIMYLVTAALGYAAYGNLTDSPILNNLPKGFISNFSVFVITLHVLLAIPVVVTTFSLEMERRLDLLKVANGDTQREDRYRVLLRIVIMGVIVGLAIAIPFFKDFMTLLGAVANTALIFVFPVVFDFKLFGFKDRPLFDKVFGILILIVGVFGGVVGGFEAIVALINDINGVPNKGGGGGHF